jgi:nucleolar protein 12
LKGKSHDNKKAVFLGNLNFKTQEEDIMKLFSKCWEGENVRLVRDATTGIGKGFGYVNLVS